MKILVCLFSLTLSQFSIAAESLPPPVEVNSHLGSSDSQVGSEAPKDTTLLATPEARACRADIEKMCKGVMPGETALLKCLKEHESGLSDECKASPQYAKIYPCHADAQKFCASIKSPKERAKCIKSHESELKDSCQDAHSRVKK